MGETVRVETRKWPDSPHWGFDAEYLGADGFGQWVGVRQGVWLSRPGNGFHAQCDQVVLLPHDAWWVATFYGDDPVRDAARPIATYVDIATPCTWMDSHAGPDDPTVTSRAAPGALVTCVDLDLDVAKTVEGRVNVLDEDEFAEHRVSLGYPAEVVTAAVESCELVRDAVAADTPPFDRTFADWLARLRHR